MTLAATYWDATLAIVRRDVAAFLSYRLRFISQTLSAFFSVVLFYYISRLVKVSTFGSPDNYFAYVVVGLVIMSSLVSTLSMLPARIRQELVAGTLERLLLSPFGAVAAIGAMILFPFLLAVVNGVITISFAALVFGMPIRATAPLALPAAALGAFAFAPFALFTAAVVVVAKQAQNGVGFLITGISLIGGFFFPVELLPHWIQWTSEVQPFSPALELLRYLLAGTPVSTSVSVALLKMALFGGVLVIPAAWSLALAIRLGQRRGTIMEY
jgi:ABC-type multidrug transport system permease subunit